MTGVTWDYTTLATSYSGRPSYARGAIDRMIDLAGAARGDRVCDIGAGTGHLTMPLLERGMSVAAVEPNAAMRAIGQQRTSGRDDVYWIAATAEATGLAPDSFGLVAFGSSFNVVDRAAALRESHRILRQRGAFACLWNHRDLDNPLQDRIERTIRDHLPGYDYGTRRQDQTDAILASGLFERVQRFDGQVVHCVPRVQWLEAWRSHATLARQAGERLDAVVAAIADCIDSDIIEIPYTTRGWVAHACG